MPAKLLSYTTPFPLAHQFVTERPSVAQNHAQVTAIILAQKSPRKISSPAKPLIYGLSALPRAFLEGPS
ncbi:hypothetical protein, partial [Pseudomonas sp. TH03]